MKISFICPLCQLKSEVLISQFHRELPSCENCQSTIRQREIIATFLLLVKHFKNARVLSLSCHSKIEGFMQKSLIAYQNTYFDQEPFLDVCNPSLDFTNYADILISSDVLEHVMFPFEKAILGCFDILKPGGWLLLTTPYFKGASFVEKYPWMKSYEVSEGGVVTGSDGINETVVVDPCFHGGPGNTLEMRIFSPEVLNLSLKQAGFENIRFLEEDVYEFGILRSVSKMGTIIARKPKKRFMGLRTDKLLEF